MTYQELLGHLRAAVGRHVEGQPREVGDDQPLTDAGLDSMSSIDLLLGLEAELGVMIPDHLLVPENFETISRLAATIHPLLAPASQ